MLLRDQTLTKACQTINSSPPIENDELLVQFEDSDSASLEGSPASNGTNNSKRKSIDLRTPLRDQVEKTIEVQSAQKTPKRELGPVEFDAAFFEQDDLDAQLGDIDTFDFEDNFMPMFNDDVEEANGLSPEAGLNRISFEAYTRHAIQHFHQMDNNQKCAIRLMQRLRSKKASLDAYPGLMQWHLEETGELELGKSLSSCKSYISRDVLMRFLKKRYNMEDKFPLQKQLILPFSRAKTTIWYHRARNIVESLLTDPRILDNDYLFFDNNPFKPPPENIQILGDVNTGLAYRETYRQIITNPRKQVLVPIILYIDGAVTGQYGKLEVTSLDMTLGIFKLKCRDKRHAWRSLGFVPNLKESKSSGKRMYVESNHIASQKETQHVQTALLDEPDDAAEKIQDKHAIFEVLLDSVKSLIEHGMTWDLRYGGTTFPNTQLVFYISFVKADNKEADLLCGRYNSRGEGVKCICRYCKCPTADAANPEANYPFKTEQMIASMVEANNLQGLKLMSQKPVNNAFHGLRFGQHNDHGIHTAVPLELLHSVLLGIMMYVIKGFFILIGKDSKQSDEIDALSDLIGELLAKNSDRDLPKTRFGHGIKKGKLMAKEYTGVMLILLCILKMKKGQNLIRSARKKHFRQHGILSDWIMLVETILTWECYLCSHEMDMNVVKRLKTKHKYLLWLLQKVCPRDKGMGWKIMKYHGILHLVMDMMHFGVPMCVDTGSNESMHKETKAAAFLTQKNPKTFEKQVMLRLDEFRVLDMALLELQGSMLWCYDYRHNTIGVDLDNERLINEGLDVSVSTSGTRIRVWVDPQSGQHKYKIVSRMSNKEDVIIDDQLLSFLCHVQDNLKDHLDTGELLIKTEHRRYGQIFRAHPNYRSAGTWQDWVQVNWGRDKLASELWCFLDLTDLPAAQSFEIGAVSVSKGVFAVVECAVEVEDDEFDCDIIQPLEKEIGQIGEDGIIERKFYLADTEAFLHPLVVIPDLDNDIQNRYFRIARRTDWAHFFESWVRANHEPIPEDTDIEQTESEEDADGESSDETDAIDEESDTDLETGSL